MAALPGTFAALAMLVQGGLCGPAIPGEEQLTSPIIVLGETHGTMEIPAHFGGLVCRSAAAKVDAAVLVGLEILSGSQASIDAYMQSDGSEAARQTLLQAEFWKREFQDGRSSVAMADLLSALRGYRKAGMKIIVRGLDEKNASAGERDARMAAAIDQALQEHHPVRTFVLVGDVHSRVLKGYPWNPSADYMPLGAVLRSRHPEAIGLSVKARKGTAWICTSGSASDCGAKRAKTFEFDGAAPRLGLDPGAEGRTGWSGTLFLEELTAAKPAAVSSAEAPAHP